MGMKRMSEFSDILKSLILAEETGIVLTLYDKTRLLKRIKDVKEKSKRIILLNTAVSSGLLSKEDIEILYKSPSTMKERIAQALYTGKPLSESEISFLLESNTDTLMNVIMLYFDPVIFPLVVLRVIQITDRFLLLILVLKELEKRGRLKEFILSFKDMEKFYYVKYNLSDVDSPCGETCKLAEDMYNDEVFCWLRESMLKVEKFLLNYGLAVAQEIISNTPPDQIKNALHSLDPIWILCSLIHIEIPDDFSPDRLEIIKNLLKYSPYFVLAFFRCLYGYWLPGEIRTKLKATMGKAFNEGVELEWDDEETQELVSIDSPMTLEYWATGEWMNWE